LKDLIGAQTSASANSSALKKARAFYGRVLVGYGDDSVAQSGGAHHIFRISPALASRL